MRQRSDRKLGCLYVLTPQGVCQRLHLTRSFVECKERRYERLKVQIVSLREALGAVLAFHGAAAETLPQRLRGLK